MAGVYHQRHPERSIFYRVFFYYFDRFLLEYENRFKRDYGYLRPIVQEVVDKYLHCGSPISTAAALQLEAVIPNFQIHEHHTFALKKSNRELCIQDYQPKNSKYHTPDLPGLGLDLNDAVLTKSPCVVVK